MAQDLLDHEDYPYPQHINDVSCPVSKKSGILKHEAMNTGGSVPQSTELLSNCPSFATCIPSEVIFYSKHLLNVTHVFFSEVAELLLVVSNNKLIEIHCRKSVAISIKLLQKTGTPNEPYMAGSTVIVESKLSQ
jgi:hypothetical protein